MKRLLIISLIISIIACAASLAVIFNIPASGAEYSKIKFEYIPAANEKTSSVYISGLMNFWKNKDTNYMMARQPDGRFILEKEFLPGRYLYKYIIDGIWVDNMSEYENKILPKPNEYPDDGFGGKNALYNLSVGSRPDNYENWILLYHIIALMVGFSALFVFTVFFFKTKSRAILNFIIILVPSIVIMSVITFSIYKISIVDNYTIVKYSFFFVDTYNERMLLNWLFHIASGILVIALPNFIYYLNERKMGPTLAASLIFVSIITALFPLSFELFFSFLKQFFHEFYEIELIVINLVIGLLIVFLIIKSVIDIQSGDKRENRKVVIAICMLFIVYLPFFTIDTFWQELQMNRRIVPYGLDFFTFFYIIFNLAALIYSLRFFNKPSALAGIEESHEDNTARLESVISEFDITGREREIILMLMQGHSSKEIGSKLNISTKTVNNHIYNIYQKTRVKNRIELSNLIKGK